MCYCVAAILIGFNLLRCSNIPGCHDQLPPFYNYVYSCSLSPDGKLAALFYASGGSICRQGYGLSILDSETGKVLHSLNLGRSFSGSICFLPDSRCMVVPTEPNTSPKAEDSRKEECQTLRIWNAVKGEEVRVFERPNEKDSEVYCIALAPDGKQALAHCRGEKLRLWDVDTGKLLRTIDFRKDLYMQVIFISPNGKQALSGSPSYVAPTTMTFWNLEEGKAIHMSPPGRVAKNTAESTWGCEIAFSPSGKWAAADRMIFYYDKPRRQDTLTIWDTSTSKVVQELPCHAISPMFTPDGKQLLCGTYDADENVYLNTWDVASGTVLSSKLISKTPSDHVVAEEFHMAFSPDGKRLLTASGGTFSRFGGVDNLLIKLWDATTGKEIRTLRQPGKLPSYRCAPGM